MNYAEVIDFVKEQTAVNGRPPNYPFRSRFEHTMRVYRWAIKLQSKLGGDLDIIVLAALLHDVGWDDERPHGEVGAEIAVNYLDSLGVDPQKIAKIGEIIMIHEEKDTDADLSLECRIVMDADLLDEVGAISVLWDSMATAIEDEASYKRAYYRIKNFIRSINQRSRDVRRRLDDLSTANACSSLRISYSSLRKNCSSID